MMVITREQVKTYLGIADTSQDAAIDAILPALDAKVKEITGRDWSDQVRGNIDGTVYVEIRTIGTDPFTDSYPRSSWSVGKDWTLDNIGEYLKTGTLVEGDGIPAGAYIVGVYDRRLTVGGITYAAPVVKLSSAATATGSIDLFLGFNIAYHRTVAKLAQWMIDDQSVDTPSAQVQSKTLGDASVTYNTNSSDLDGKYGVPRWAVVGLPRFGRGY